jgi:hypothetical protein
MARPLSTIKAHPVLTITAFAGGMILGPWVTSTLQGLTGVGVSLPVVRSGG